MNEVKWTDYSLSVMDVGGILDEDLRQVEKWGVQIRSPFEWLAYLMEEVGELSEAISEHVYRQGNREDIKKEAIQVATLAMKIAKMSMRKEE